MSPRSTVDIRPSLSTSGVPLTGKEGINCVWWENMKMKEDKLLCEYLVYPKYPKNALSPDCKGATVYNVLMWLTFVYSSSKIVMVRGLLYFCVVDQSRLFFLFPPCARLHWESTDLKRGADQVWEDRFVGLFGQTDPLQCCSYTFHSITSLSCCCEVSS